MDLTDERQLSIDADLNREQIARALELAEARRNALAYQNNDTAIDNYKRQREPRVYSPHEYLKVQLNDGLGRWFRLQGTAMEGRPADEFFMPKALAALEFLDSALELLGAKTGDRAETTRAALTDQRKMIADAIAHIESLGALLDGPLAKSLVDRIAAGRVAIEAAGVAKDHATRATVEASLLEIEKCQADARELDRDVAATKSKLWQLPTLPDAQAFKDAQLATAAIECNPGKRPTARAVHRAIDQGIIASPEQARLWIIFETSADHELLKWRWRAVAEGTSK
ncbi:MAG TPA: hypothetical protein VHW01_21710 [Polyangiaceae bacterium]|jgi:hypothetical protein|nr:hypothetical protein [Polyangiaceae bacterium]